MSVIIYIVLLLFQFMPIITFAIGNDEVLLGIEDTDSSKNWRILKDNKNQNKEARAFREKTINQYGNISNSLKRKVNETSSSGNSALIVYPSLEGLNKSGLDVGDVFDCIIEQDIKAYAGSVSPIVAEVLSGPHQGLLFIGNATMDTKTKDIVVEFNKIRDLSFNQKHELKATLHNSTGQFGIKGTFSSQYWQYFFATVLSKTAEGYAQASVQRDRNIFGTYQNVPSTENAGKSAVAEAASATTNLVSDRLKNLPEFVTKQGPIRTKIFITETPKLIN